MAEFNKLQTGNFQIDTIQKRLITAFDLFINKPNVIQRQVIEDIRLEGGQINLIEHRLGHVIRGADIIKCDESLISCKWIDGYDLALYLPIVVSTGCTVSFEVW